MCVNVFVKMCAIRVQGCMRIVRLCLCICVCVSSRVCAVGRGEGVVEDQSLGQTYGGSTAREGKEGGDEIETTDCVQTKERGQKAMKTREQSLGAGR